MATKSADFLSKRRKGDAPPILVVHGDEDFLARQVLIEIRHWVLGDEPDDMALSEYEGPDVALATVLDELFTPPFLTDRRLLIVDAADPFVTAHRAALERYADNPSRCGVLALRVTSWPANTKLAKAVESVGLAIEASSPKAWLVANWCMQWAKRYQKTLDKPAAEWLVEQVGTNLGQLDQELAKLAGLAGDAPTISIELVRQNTAGTRMETVFKLFDMLVEGELAKALELMDRLFVAGESPVGVLAMMSAQLRKLAKAARLTESGTSTPEALKQVGVPPFAIDKSRAQLNHFGRPRMEAIWRKLIATDLDLKGASGLAPRMVVERFMVELARPRATP